MNNIVCRISKGINSPNNLVFFTTIFGILCCGATGDSQPAKMLVSNAFGEKQDEKGISRAVLSRSPDFGVFGETFFPRTVRAMYYSILFGMTVNTCLRYLYFYYITIKMNALPVKKHGTHS